MKKVCLITAMLGIQFLALEIVFRFFFFGFTEGFFLPYQALLTRCYPELIPVFSQNSNPENNVKKVLILGGSVVSTNWSHLEKRLDTMLLPHFPKGTEIRVMNAAAPANSSLDNLIKYKALTGYHFDLVIFYEAINETRFNNIPPNFFKNDYTHVKWYQDVNLILEHPELRFTVLPYTLHFIYVKARDYYTKPPLLDMNGVASEFIMYGSQIKTSTPYRDNIQALINTVQSRKQRILLMSYASYFPEGIKLLGKKSEETLFGDCTFRTNINLWGDADNVKKGIQAHNQQMVELVARNKVDFLDMASLMPSRKQYFCDVCHLSPGQGAQQFATIVKDYIVSHKLLVP